MGLDEHQISHIKIILRKFLSYVTSGVQNKIKLLISGTPAILSSQHCSLLGGMWEVVQTLSPRWGFQLAVPLQTQLGAAWPWLSGTHLGKCS